MTLEEFAKQGDIEEATIIAVKDEGLDGDGHYRFYLCAHVKEFPFMVLQEDSWSEEALIESARTLYDDIREHEKNKNGLFLPNIGRFVVEIVSDEKYWQIINK